jgi:nitrile hydratase
MDTIHDLGGREGFGPVRWQDDDDDSPFHHHWQARTWAICMIMFATLRREQTGWTLDWSRHVLERLPPADYLAMNYFEKWAQHMMALLIDDEQADIEEFVDGHSNRERVQIAPKTPSAITEPGEPKFFVGDTIRTRRSIGSMHTRLPGFVRGFNGVVDAWHGPDILADASAMGDLLKEHLYTVKFESSTLWPDAGERPFSVRVDLWESYLEAP